jgi:hypothetical protein
MKPRDAGKERFDVAVAPPLDSLIVSEEQVSARPDSHPGRIGVALIASDLGSDQRPVEPSDLQCCPFQDVVDQRDELPVWGKHHLKAHIFSAGAAVAPRWGGADDSIAIAGHEMPLKGVRWVRQV